MTGRERFLVALENGRPDRLPCQVHNWMRSYLDAHLGGCDPYAAYGRFGMDPVIYTGPRFVYDEKDLSNWRVEREERGEPDGTRSWRENIATPGGALTRAGAANAFTSWDTEHLIKNERDFGIWERWVPLPARVDWTPVLEAKRRIGGTGIVRGGYFGFGQGSPWQDFCWMHGTEPAIMATFDRPEWVAHVLDALLAKKLAVIERGGPCELDLVETGGGAGSSTVISPDLHERWCLPYDRRQIEALHAAGTRVVYHLCGGVMPMLELAAGNGADALETMTPPSMGGDCDLAEAARRVGRRLAFIGGFDQNRGFERGNPELVHEMVRALFEARPEGGYICAPSDHFFSGDPENIQAFADAARECVY